jgi:hypothetical protein
MRKQVTNLDVLKKVVPFVNTCIFRLDDEGQFLPAKKLTLQLRGKMNYSGSVSSVYKIKKKKIGSNAGKPMIDVRASPKEKTFWLHE